MLTEEFTQLRKLQRAVDEANELADRFIQGYTNYDAEYVGNKLSKAKAALGDYLDSITEKKMAFIEEGGTKQLISGESFKLKASIQTYELSNDDLKKMFSSHLGVPADRISITAREKVISSDPMDRSPTVYGFDGLTITVKN